MILLFSSLLLLVFVLLVCRQGNVLSPVLFNIFINDIGKKLSLEYATVLHDIKICHLMYADDLVLLSTSEKCLQQNLDRVNEFCSNWDLKVNTDKSKVMVFSKTGCLSKDKFQFVIGGEEISVNHWRGISQSI